jgi:hypothetical protein
LYPSTGRRAKTIKGVRSFILQVPFIRQIQWNPMEDTDLQALMARLELLIERVEQLKSKTHSY